MRSSPRRIPSNSKAPIPLPEAQLDRFLMKIRIGYPDAAQEAQVLQNYQDGFDPRELQRAGFRNRATGNVCWRRAQETAAVRVEPGSVPITSSRLVGRTRNSAAVSLGASPRAAISLMLFAKAIAATEGRDYLIPDDVKVAAPPILRHRLVLQTRSGPRRHDCRSGCPRNRPLRRSSQMSALAHLVPADDARFGKPAKRISFAFGRRFFLLLLIGLVWLGPAWSDSAISLCDGVVGRRRRGAVDLGSCADFPGQRKSKCSRVWSQPAATRRRSSCHARAAELSAAFRLRRNSPTTHPPASDAVRLQLGDHSASQMRPQAQVT